MKFISKEKKYAIIELKKFEKFDWIYFATNGIDMGLIEKGRFQEVGHFIPVKSDKVRIKIEVMGD